MTNPLVSVILPVYNRENLVSQAIESVLAQTYSHWELLVVDDGSNDGTRAVLDSYGEQLTVLSTNRLGAYGARNAALDRAKGELVAFIDSDDRWLPRRLELQLPLFKPTIGLVFGNAVFRDARRGRDQLRSDTYFDLLPPCRGRVLEQLAVRNFIPQSSVIVRRSCFDKVGPFSTATDLACDYAKWVEIAMNYEVDFVPDVVFEYTQHAGNLSRDLSRSFHSRVVLFEGILAKTSSPEQRAALYRLLFNLNLYLAVTDARRMFHYIGRAFFSAALPVPAIRRWRWSVEFVKEAVRLAVARLKPRSRRRQFS